VNDLFIVGFAVVAALAPPAHAPGRSPYWASFIGTLTTLALYWLGYLLMHFVSALVWRT
jgi:hypothetical protein